jgi:hypothetical protein
MSHSSEIAPFDGRDWFLQSLIDLVNGREIEIGLTLHAGGFLVSGLLVSGHQYFEGFGAEFARTFDDADLTQNIHDAYAKYGGIYTAAKPAGEVFTQASYIHLKNARFFSTSGAPIPANMAVWWRGRVAEVSGFFLGMLSAES